MISPAKRPSKKIIYLGIVAFLVIVVILIAKNHSARELLGEKGLTYRAGDVNNPCPADALSPGNPCVTEAIKDVVSSDNADKNNLTKGLSKTFFTSYLNAQDEGGNVAENERINIIQNTVAGAPPTSSTAPVKYILSALNVFDPQNSDEIKAYGNDFAQIYRSQLAAYAELNQPNYEQSANYFKNLAEALSRMKVPRPIADIHLALLNSYNQMYVALLDLNNYDSDPLKGFYALVNFRNNQNVVPTYLAKLANYFKTNGIIFSKSEPGSFWLSS